MHSKQFAKIKKYYDDGFWNVARVRNAVVKGVITEEEFAEITGKIMRSDICGNNQ